jgi:hypothetical protein
LNVLEIYLDFFSLASRFTLNQIWELRIVECIAVFVSITNVDATYEFIFTNVVDTWPDKGSDGDQSVMDQLVFVLMSSSGEVTMGLQYPTGREIKI